MKIDVELLRGCGACEDGVDLFIEHFGNATPVDHLELLQHAAQFDPGVTIDDGFIDQCVYWLLSQLRRLGVPPTLLRLAEPYEGRALYHHGDVAAESSVTIDKSIIVYGRLLARQDVKAGGHLVVGVQGRPTHQTVLQVEGDLQVNGDVEVYGSAIVLGAVIAPESSIEVCGTLAAYGRIECADLTVGAMTRIIDLSKAVL